MVIWVAGTNKERGVLTLVKGDVSLTFTIDVFSEMPERCSMPDHKYWNYKVVHIYIRETKSNDNFSGTRNLVYLGISTSEGREK